MKSKLFHLLLFLTKEESYPYLNLGKKPSALSPHLEELITANLSIIGRLAYPRGLIRHCSISRITDDIIFLEDANLMIKGRHTIQHFCTCDKITLLASTLGPKVDAYLEELKKSGSATELFVFNGIASAAIEHSTEQLDALAVQEVNRNSYYPTARFSPGYGDWPLECQKDFLDSVAAEQIGLTATSYHLLEPVKSVTAIIGWSKVPLERSYNLDRQKPCQGTLTCRECAFKDKCSASHHRRK